MAEGQVLVPSTNVDITGSSTAATVLTHLKELDLFRTAHAVFLFGSYAAKNETLNSDVDILILSETEPFGREFELANLLLDITADSYDGFRARMEGNYQRNNNFILNALSSSIIIHATSSHAYDLIVHAQHIRAAGPVPITSDAAIRSSNALARLSHATKRLVFRAGRNSEALILARMRCDKLILEAIYLHCKANRWWTSSFAETVSFLQYASPSIYRLWQEYASSELIESQFAIASQVAAHALDELRHAIVN